MSLAVYLPLALPALFAPFAGPKIAAGMGLPSTVRNTCSSASPLMPTGIVARMSIHASRWSGVWTWRSRTEVSSPLMIRSQSRQKNASSAAAVATCRPTMSAR